MSFTLSTAQLVSAVAEMTTHILATMEPEQEVQDAPDPGPRRTPRALRLWLARLRLLEAVPFSHLVADATLLPPESIRFFHVDRGWTDALVEGALSVGTVTTADRATLEAIYPMLRPEVDEAERLVRLPGWERGANVPSGPAGPISGFLLRSRLVSGWPAMTVRGYGRDNFRLTGALHADDEHVGMGNAANAAAQERAMQKREVLRFERLAPAVLLVLFDGVPEVVHLEEPRAGVQFGFEDTTAPSGRVSMTSRTRDVTNGDGLSETVPVPFRRGAPGVVHIGELMNRLAEVDETNIGSRKDAATLAMQLLQFPWRAVFGDQSLQEDGGAAPDMSVVFHPEISYEIIQDRIAQGPLGHPYPVSGVAVNRV
ncbi:hypothetical protein [Microbacterium sp. A93]|uniref:hypothetical protein n=1 Tax=Microbacterium sp. A93 TaxID=3450716 RepID=UPI003F42A7F9